MPVANEEPKRTRERIFLCHSSGDKAEVRTLYARLRADGFDPWLDEEDILPGHDWEHEIRSAVRSSAIVVVCLSSNSVTKTGYLQKEIAVALDVAAQQPEGHIFIIPVRLQDCEVPERLKRWQWVKLFESSGYERLVRALAARGLPLQSKRAATMTSSTSLSDHSSWMEPQAGKNSRFALKCGPNIPGQSETRELPLVIGVLSSSSDHAGFRLFTGPLR
jgi:hypothetical protein